MKHWRCWRSREHLGIQTSHNAWREHLYELRGWKDILPLPVVQASLLPEPPDVRANINLPQINFRLRRSEPFPVLEQMMPVHAGLSNQRVELSIAASTA